MLGRSVGSILDQIAQNHGPREAVVAGDRRYTYQEYFERLRKTGRGLRSLGLEAGDRVAIICSDRLEVIDVYYGAMWANLVTVPLNPRLPEDDHAYILQSSGATALLYDGSVAERIAALAQRVDGLQLIAAEPDAMLDGAVLLSDLTAVVSGDFGAPQADLESPVLLAHTGGTTGRPKGVTHTHSTLLAALYSYAFECGFEQDERCFHVTPLAHAAGFMFLPVWLKGGANYLTGGFDPPSLLAAIERERLTASFLIPTMIYMLLNTSGISNHDLSSLRTVTYGGAPISMERLIEATKVMGPAFVQVYGQAEAPGQITVLRREDHVRALAEGDGAMLRSCGSPVLIGEVMMADDDLNPVPDGEVGEICIRGPHVMKGYWNNPEETAISLRDGWLCTGDNGRFDPVRGVYTIVDRKKDMIISGGYNVYPAMVERVLFAHPAVANVAVIGVPHEKWGEAVKAVVVKRADVDVTEAQLIEFAREAAGKWSAPGSVDFVNVMPLTPSNKVDKRTLRAPYWEGRDRAVN
ncbi:Long-chain-fatty-acid-CoA ligase [Candidatus Protofrankia californiensis]|uniref:Long-chain-fatty-acid-CoA ligase n=1 Tax=Candidatus Protofrankia californiensis TaxID=1839754 RepID=A0A1C3NZ31_9ACTN|nr:Long-chain-fatty-acid-CoA ligase [Candidatus Protofrankia californiensis]